MTLHSHVTKYITEGKIKMYENSAAKNSRLTTADFLQNESAMVCELRGDKQSVWFG